MVVQTPIFFYPEGLQALAVNQNTLVIPEPGHINTQNQRSMTNQVIPDLSAGSQVDHITGNQLIT